MIAFITSRLTQRKGNEKGQAYIKKEDVCSVAKNRTKGSDGFNQKHKQAANQDSY